jgi:electron transfer flavoprotein alpha subunit
MASLEARHALFGDAGQDGDVGRRVAVALGERPAVAVQRIQDGSVVSRGAGGVDFHRPAPRILLLAQGAGDPFDGPPQEARTVEAPLLPATVGGLVRDLGPELLSVADMPLGEADFIVSAGDGVTDWPAFFDLAEALSGTIGGSRQVCDAGLLPRSRQVGASGTLVDAKCYLAFGISGAPQHLQGIQRCRLVAAVNTDLHAAMVKRADIAIIADAQDVMPALATFARAKRHAR